MEKKKWLFKMYLIIVWTVIAPVLSLNVNIPSHELSSSNTIVFVHDIGHYRTVVNVFSPHIFVLAICLTMNRIKGSILFYAYQNTKIRTSAAR
ncbi:conserved hypothetical protein [Ricinus communis]|uniref:Uncharacterized protein n=1 Tax=Ricinus communis TaxID=3988 RepID=B9RUZ4_RICCO|nr:conserved hypothetical protein [Ricinus communis]